MDPDFVYERIPETHAVFVPSLRYVVIRALGIEPESIEGRDTMSDAFNDALRQLALEERVRTRFGYYDRRVSPEKNPLFVSEHVPLEMQSFWPIYRTVERSRTVEEESLETMSVLAYADPTNT